MNRKERKAIRKCDGCGRPAARLFECLGSEPEPRLIPPPSPSILEKCWNEVKTPSGFKLPTPEWFRDLLSVRV